MQPKLSALDIRAVVFKEGDWWSAQCLEYDVVAQAESLSELRKELERVLAAYVALSGKLGRKPFEDMQRAPDRFWLMYERAQIIPDRPAEEPRAEAGAFPDITPHLRIAEPVRNHS